MSEMVYGIILGTSAIVILGIIAYVIYAIVLFVKEKYVRSQIGRIDFIIKKDTLRNDGVIRDADTVLADIMQNADFEITGLGKEIFEIYKKTSDKEAFENLFYSLSGETFENFIGKCEKV